MSVYSNDAGSAGEQKGTGVKALGSRSTSSCVYSVEGRDRMGKWAGGVRMV